MVNVTLFVVSFSLCFHLLEVNGTRQLTIRISDLDKLESSLRTQGASETLVRTIYAAANCDLKRNKILDQKLDKLLSPIENLHQKVNEALNKVIVRSGELNKAPEDTLNIFINMAETQQQLNDEVEMMNELPTERMREALVHHVSPAYAPLKVKEQVITPELCKTVQSMQSLAVLANQKKLEILGIAKTVYGFSGSNSISDLARFYIDYVRNNYELQNQVMGLAKLLGDFASTSSEYYILENTISSNKEPCGFMMEHARRRRNVQLSQLTGGKCMKEVGNQVNRFHNTSCLSKITHAANMNFEALFTYAKKCNSRTSFELGVFERENSDTVISAGYENGEVCLNIKSCPSHNKVITSDGETCASSDKKPVCSTDIDNFRVSLITGRFSKSEIPDDLKLLNKKYCSIKGVVIDSKGPCSKPIKTTQRFTMFLIEGSWMMTDRDVLIAHGQDVTNICFYDCTGCYNNCTRCKGDETYISNFGSWSGSSCTCNYCHDCSELFVQIDDSRFGVDATFSAEWSVTTPVTEEREIECKSCKASCNGYTIKIERDAKFDIIHLCVEKTCEIINHKEVDFSYLITEKFMHSANFIIHFYRSDGKGMKTAHVRCSDGHTCMAISCDVCLTRFANPHCYKFVNWIILILGVSAAVLAIPLLYSLYVMAKLALLIILVPSKALWRFSRLLFRACYRVTNKSVKATTDKVNVMLREEELNDVKVSKPSSSRIMLFIVLAFLIIQSASGCENSITITTKSEECVTNPSGTMKCSVTSITDVPLSSLGEESCLRITDPMGQLSELVKIKTKALRQKCSKNVLYYTAEPEFKLLNSFRCRNAGSCKDDACEKVTSDGAIPVDSVDEKKAGINGCLRVTGFWGKGCFYADQACQFYKVELENSKKTSYEVFNCREWFWEIVVDITTQSHSINSTETKEIVASVPTKTSLGFAQLITVVSPVTTKLDGCFATKLEGVKKTSLISCSAQSKFSGRVVGSIQCATSSLAKAASKSCIIDSTLLQVIPQDDNLVLINNHPNVTEDWARGLLPTNYTSSIISEDGLGSVLIQYTGRAAYTLRLKMNEYKVSQLINRPKCEAHFRSLKGCSNCGSGAETEIEVLVTPPSKTPGTLRCPSAVTSSSSLINSASPKTIFKVAFRKPEISETCSLECGSSNLSIQVEGRLLQVVNLQEQKDSRALGKYYDYFASLPWLHFGGLRYFYLAIGTLIVTPLIVLVYKGIKIYLLGPLRGRTYRAFYSKVK